MAEVFFGLRTHVGMLDKQIALIVGAGGGIGRAVVARYLREGASVLAVERNRAGSNRSGENSQVAIG